MSRRCLIGVVVIALLLGGCQSGLISDLPGRIPKPAGYEPGTGQEVWDEQPGMFSGTTDLSEAEAMDFYLERMPENGWHWEPTPASSKADSEAYAQMESVLSMTSLSIEGSWLQDDQRVFIGYSSAGTSRTRLHFIFCPEANTWCAAADPVAGEAAS